MNLAQAVKGYAERLPGPLARIAAQVPFSLRLGRNYTRTRNLVGQLGASDRGDRKLWAFRRLRELVDRVYLENAFYRTIYDRRRYHPSKLRSLDHFNDVPIVSKADLQEFPLEVRSRAGRGRILVNTGGSQGEPLAFYVDANAFAREWGHMHWIWERRGYDYRDLKLTLRGKSLQGPPVRYNAVHNELVVDAYMDREAVFDWLRRSGRLRDVRWLHGYPSLVADFCSAASARAPELVGGMKGSIKGALLGSEFPAPHYRNAITGTLECAIVAWYGHSEMCILAYEDVENEYVPLLTYGWCEAQSVGDGATHLIGTSYWNTVSPFVRYDTGDGIDADVDEGVVSRFRITDGRIGEFVLDAHGRAIGLTALIFGRHHLGFEMARHVQLRQTAPGVIELLVVPRDPAIEVDSLARAFDFSNVDLSVSITTRDAPLRTRSGKTPLLVRDP